MLNIVRMYVMFGNPPHRIVSLNSNFGPTLLIGATSHQLIFSRYWEGALEHESEMSTIAKALLAENLILGKAEQSGFSPNLTQN